jgi:histidine ammonia-lyase
VAVESISDAKPDTESEPGIESDAELVLDGHRLRISDVAGLARSAAPRQPRLADDAAGRCAASNALKRALVDSRQPIYGVTTGFGDSASRQISPAKTTALQRNLVRYHLNGVGPVAADEVARATVLIRANCLARGASGIRVEVVERLLDLLRHDVLPMIPERGSVGASGDLVPLCYLASVLQGDGRARRGGTERPTAELFAEVGIEGVTLEAKEGLALINGTSFMSAFACLAAADAAELAFAADLCSAIAAEVLFGNKGHYADFLHLAKPHPGQLRSAGAVRDFLADSALAVDHEQLLDDRESIADRSYVQLDRRIQDTYSVRCAPHVVGVLRDTLAWVEPWLEVEINSSNDNPLFDVDAGCVRSGGNFYGGHVGQAMDALKVAVASVADLLDRQLELIVDEKFNQGMTPNLIPPVGPDDPSAGLRHGYKGMQIACSSLAAEALKLTMPATSFSRSTEAHNQDKVSMGTIAARDARTVVELTRAVTAIHLHALCQALDLRGVSRAGAAARAAHALIREQVPMITEDRSMDADITHIADLIRSGALRRAVTHAQRPLAPVGQGARP